MILSLGMFLYVAKYAEEGVAAAPVVVLASLVVFTINRFRNGSTEPAK